MPAAALRRWSSTPHPIACSIPTRGGWRRGNTAVETPFIAFNKTQTDTFGDVKLEVRDIRAVGGRVLVLAEVIARATGSGVPIRQQVAHVLSDFRDGMVGEDRTFLSWDAGLKAAGLKR